MSAAELALVERCQCMTLGRVLARGIRRASPKADVLLPGSRVLP
jgi:hypothetical protein